jgi:two-component system phosphate regulon response regulator PhoB
MISEFLTRPLYPVFPASEPPPLFAPPRPSSEPPEPEPTSSSLARVSTFRVLIVEPDSELKDRLTADFQREGFSVESAASAYEGTLAMRRSPADALILSLRLPDRPGLDLCRELRASKATRDVPILTLTEQTNEAEHVTALEAGADDYIIKPFSSRQIILRTKAVLRRSGVLTVTAERIESGPISVDSSAHRVFLNGAEVPLTSTEYRLLLLLLRHPGRVFSRSELLDHVWNMPNRVVTRTVDTHVKRLRQKLRGAGSPIETVRNAGYRYGSPPWENSSS